MIPGIQTERNSDDRVECQMSDLVRWCPPKIPNRTPGQKHALVTDGVADEQQQLPSDFTVAG